MQFEETKATYKNFITGNDPEIGTLTDQITLKEIYRCYGGYRGKVVTFFNRLSVLAKKRVWLDDAKIDHLLNSEKIERLEKIIDTITTLRSSIIDQWSDEHSIKYQGHKVNSRHLNLVSYQRRLALLNKLIFNNINRRKDANPDEEVGPPNNADFNEGVQAAKEATRKWECASKVEVLDESKAVVNLAFKEAINKKGRILPKILKDMFISLFGIKTIINIGVANVIAFIQKKIVAESAGNQFLNALSEENRKVLDRYVELEQKIISIEGHGKDQGYFNALKTYIKDAMLHKGERLADLKQELKALEPKINQLRELYKNNKVGSAIPGIRDTCIDALDRHLHCVTQTVIHLRKRNPNFDSLPNSIKEYLIIGEMNQMQETGTLKKLNSILISLPDLPAPDQESLSQLLKEVEQGRGNEPETKDALKLMDEKLAKAMVQQCSDQIDRQATVSGKIAVQKIIFPHGLPLHWFPWVITKIFRVNMDKIEEKIAKIMIKKVMAQSSPSALNRRLERRLDLCLQKIEQSQAIKELLASLENDLATYEAECNVDKYKETSTKISELTSKLKKMKEVHPNAIYKKVLSGSDNDVKDEKEHFGVKCKEIAFNVFKLAAPCKNRLINMVEFAAGYPKITNKWIEKTVKAGFDKGAITFDNPKLTMLMKKKIERLKNRESGLNADEDNQSRGLRVEQKLLKLAEAARKKVKEKNMLLSLLLLPVKADLVSNSAKNLYDYTQMPVLNRMFFANLFADVILTI